MKISLSELIIIMVVIGIVLLVVRGMPGRNQAAAPPQVVKVRRPTAAELEEARIKTARQKRLRWLGGAFVIVGVVVLASTFKVFSYLFDSMFMLSAGAGVIILAGIVVLVLSTRR